MALETDGRSAGISEGTTLRGAPVPARRGPGDISAHVLLEDLETYDGGGLC